MKPQLHVLLIDDSPEDADLVILELKKEFDPVHARVDKGPALEAALKEKTWDIIIADFVMPQFSGLAALKMVQQHDLDTPFVIISGNVGEEVAVEAMKAGAHDYLIKNKLTRLIPAVKREIREAAIRHQRRQTEDALHSSQLMFQSLVEQSLVGIYICQNGLFIYANPKCGEIFGYHQKEMIAGKAFSDLVAFDQRNTVIARFQQLDTSISNDLQFQFRGIRSDSTIIELEAHITKMIFNGQSAIIGTILDITERMRTEDELRQAQKLEAIGRLAGGISHDFNNLLTIINGYSTLVLRGLEGESPFRKEVEFILHAGERAADLTRQLLTFSRRQIAEPQVLQVNYLVTNLQKMLCRLLGEQYYLNTKLSRDVGSIKADPSQIEQIIMNLVVNARDALENGGEIIVETGNANLDGDPERPHVFIRVTDNGSGMTDEVRAHVFEPFFTTKEQGKGTGLGLATVYGIVQQSGGSITISTEPGKGSSFTVYLPRVFSDHSEPVEKWQSSSCCGEQTILVVEDEIGVLQLVEKILGEKGYNVLAASLPEEAVTLFEKHQEAIDLLLTDVAMPCMGGTQLADLLRDKKPDLRVLLMSGYIDGSSRNENIGRSGYNFIAKPFISSTLLDKVGQILQISCHREGNS